MNRPFHPRDLADHACLGDAFRDRWRYAREKARVAPKEPPTANGAGDGTAGSGVATRPGMADWSV